MSTDLAVIEAALKAATPGPWETWPHTHLEDGCRCLSCQFVTVWQTRNGIDCEDVARKPGESERCEAAGYSWEDANLIANAPAWLAELVERVKVAEDHLHNIAEDCQQHRDRALAAEAAIERVRAAVERAETRGGGYAGILHGSEILRALDGDA